MNSNPEKPLLKQETFVDPRNEYLLLPDSPSKMTFVGRSLRSRMRTDDDAVSTYSAVTFGESVRDSEDSMSVGSRLETLVSIILQKLLTSSLFVRSQFLVQKSWMQWQEMRQMHT